VVEFPVAECWVIEPPDPPHGFHDLVGYLINAGVDISFGPNDTLPNDLPPSCDGIRVIVTCLEDLPRLRRRLRGFVGLDPDTDSLEGVAPHGTMYLHENGRTWLAAYSEKGRFETKRIENPLIVAPDVTINSPAMRARMLARSDRDVHRMLLEGLMQSDRHEWSDVSFGTLWAMIGAFEATGEERYREAAVRFADTQLARWDAGGRKDGGPEISSLAFLRLSEVSGDPRYRKEILAAIPEVPEKSRYRPAFGAVDDFRKQVGTGLLLQAHSFVHPATRAVLESRAADGGTYSEQVGLELASVLAAARAGGWSHDATPVIAACLAAHRENCRDPETGLYYHGLLGRRGAHKGFQGHGMLWTCFGLQNTLEQWPTDDPAYAEVLRMYGDACDAAATVQDPETGEFHHILDMPQSPFGRIYTPALAYVFLRGARLGLLSGEFHERGIRAWEAMKCHIFQGGSVGGDAGTPQMKRFEAYLLQPVTYNYRSNRTRCFWQAHAANEVLRTIA